ncbi:DUF488 domain-containing protein [Streptomyces sp. NPDC054784]
MASREEGGPRPDVRVWRVYDPPEDGGGARVLVDRLWPRGMAKDRARLDAWLREVAPSPELRRWYGHDPARFEEFSARYRAELDGREDAPPEAAEALERLRACAAEGPLTLLTATRDTDRGHAAVLADLLTRRP